MFKVTILLLLPLSGSPLSPGHVRGQWVRPVAGQGTLPLPADQRGRTLFFQGRHHQREPAGGRGLVGRLPQRQEWVVPQQLRAGAERKWWVLRALLQMWCIIRRPHQLASCSTGLIDNDSLSFSPGVTSLA